MSETTGPGHPPPGIGDEVTVSVQHLGGIESATVRLTPGITILTGENATNRTSFLRSLAAALGGASSAVTLKSDADAGRVELRTDGATYDRVYGATGIDRMESDPLTDAGDLVDTFVAIDERNPARRAIRGGGEGLRDILMGPVDTASIKADIRERQRERSELESERDRIEAKKGELPDLEARKADLDSDLESVTAEIERVEATIEAAAVEEADAADLEDRHAEQTQLRESIGETERMLERQRDQVKELEAEHDHLSSDLEAIEVEADRLSSIRDEIERLERRQRELDGIANDLATVIEVNRDLLEGEHASLGADSDVTAALDPSSARIECWTCGSEVLREDVVERFDALREQLQATRGERERIVDEIADLEEQAAAIEADERRQRQLRDRLAETESELDLRRERVAELEATLEDHREALSDLEAELESAEPDAGSEVAEAYDRLSELEYERGRLSEERSRVAEEIETIRGQLADDLPEIESRLEAVGAEIESLRDRVASLERSVIETFDDHMNALIERLAYQNVERVWLERRTQSGSGPETGAEFVLHVVRARPDGTVYEDPVDTLSESERELIGIVVALVGYLVHEVGTQVPFVLLDSVEAIDAERLATILEYVGDHVPFVLAAVLPEEAAALPEEYARVPAAALTQG